MDRKKPKVCCISAGVPSSVAGWLVRDTVDKLAETRRKPEVKGTAETVLYNKVKSEL